MNEVTVNYMNIIKFEIYLNDKTSNVFETQELFKGAEIANSEIPIPNSAHLTSMIISAS